MKAIKKSLCFALTILSAAFTARAVDPVAVWSGNFNINEKAGISIIANSNQIASDGSNITIADSSKGVQFDLSQVSDFGQRISVIVKYADLNQSGISGNKSLISVGQVGSGKTTYDDVGVRTTGSTAFTGYYSNTGNYGSQTYTAPKSGYILFNYSVEADHNIGVRCYIGEKNDNGTYTWSGRIGADNLRFTAAVYRFTKLAVGGPNSSNNGPIAGMKIEAVAIFNSDLDTAAAAAYVFPEPEVETVVLTNDNGTGSLGGVGNYQPDALLIPDSSGIEAGKIVKVKSVTFVLDSSAAANANWISINGVQSSSKTISGTWPNTAYPLVTYNYGDGVDIEIGKSAPMVASGDSRWRLFANVTDADRQYIGMTNTTDMNRGYRPAYKIVLEVPIGDVKNPSKAEITTNTAWADLDWDAKPTASDKAELTVSANAILTFDETTAFKSLKLIGSADLTIDGLASSNIGLIQKINVSSFTGKLRFEIDASAGLTADDALKNFIRTASDKMTFVFKSTVTNKGAALGYGFVVNAAIHSHIVFDGGTHTMSYGYGGSGADGNCFGINASNSNPTVLVTGNATLNFTAKDFSYWTGVADINGVIRVNNGATLNFLADGRNTIYYRQRLCLEPGAKVTFPDVLGGNDSKPVMRFLGGTTEGKEVIYVLPPTGGETTATISGNVFLPKDDTHGFGVFVDANSRLKWTGNMPVYDNNDDKAVVKRGAGVFEYYGTMDGVVQVLAGSIAGTGSFRKLTLNDSATLNLDNGTPTITGSLVTATEKQLKLAITSPVHGMSVITLPDAADKTGWTARVNGREAENELIAEGNTLKLKWKIPPTIELEADDVTIETADDWNGGVVTIDIGSLTEGDYKDEIAYSLKFGDKTVTGSAANGVATFELSADDFTAGNIYRGTFELEYGTGNEPIVAAEVTVYAGEKTYGTKEGWINETTTSFMTTGSYSPENGASVGDGFIKFLHTADVVFTPTNSPADYVAKCDSTVTFEIFSGEEAIQDDDDTVAADLQAGVKIVDDGSVGVKFQFISGDEWIDGPAAALNTTYEVKISFHYAKEEGDTDSITYAVKDLTQGPVVVERRANTAEKLEAIAFADGTQIASLTGTCQIEVANPVEKETGLAPGADGKELKATDETAAQAEAEKIPVLVPSEVEGDLTKGLDEAAAKEAKEKYKAWFQVVAKPGESGKWVASVVPTEKAEETAEKEVQKVSTDVLAEVTALTGDQTEGTATISEAVPGFFYGVAENGEVVNMKTAEPEEWKMAGASGKVELKVTKPANAKARFYKIVCSPLPPSEE